MKLIFGRSHILAARYLRSFFFSDFPCADGPFVDHSLTYFFRYIYITPQPHMNCVTQSSREDQDIYHYISPFRSTH